MAPSTSSSAPSATKVWLITGCSSGFGREIAISARNRGDLVTATARKIETLDSLKKIGCEALALDVVASDEDVEDVVAQAVAFYGHIDVLVNNAGFSANGAVEESSSKEVLDLFETNVFGLLRVTRAVLPYMREKKSGTIANIGSLSGNVPFPTTGIYSATKFAVAGLTKTLRLEVAPFGIEVTVIEPDMFRTSILSSMRLFEKTVEDYEPIAKQFFAFLNSDSPIGDPVTGAQAIVEALTKTGRAKGRELPNRLYLGVTTREYIASALARAQQELKDWAAFTEPSAFVESK